MSPGSAAVHAQGVLLVRKETGTVEYALAHNQQACEMRIQRFFPFCVVAAAAMPGARFRGVASWNDHRTGFGRVESHLSEEQQICGFSVDFEELGGMSICWVCPRGFGLAVLCVGHAPLQQARNMSLMSVPPRAGQ